MQLSDKGEFLKVLNGLASIKRAPITQEALELWWGCMADWDIGDFKQSAMLVLKRTDFMPTPKDFEDLRRAGQVTPGEAWDKAVRWASSSNYRSGPSGDAAIDQCVRMIGGYSAIAMCDEDKLHFLERRFTEHYEAVEDARSVRVALPSVAMPARLTSALRALEGAK